MAVGIAYFDMQKRIDASGALIDAEIPYIVTGVNDEDAAIAAVKGTAAANLAISSGGSALGASAPLVRIEIDERLNKNSFRVKAIYEKETTTTPTSSGGSSGGSSGSTPSELTEWMTFETGGGTRHLTVSKGTSKYPSSAPDYGGAIGVDQDGTVHGVDVTMPALTFAINKVYNSFSESNIAHVSSFTGKVNSGSFHGFNAGEVLFLGASGGQRSDRKWEVSYKFSVSPNESGFSVGGIGVSNKKGWQYAWVKYKDEVSGDAVVRKPEAVYVETVYESVSFSGLVV